MPAAGLLFERVRKHGREPRLGATPNARMAAPAGIPLLSQPGDSCLCHARSGIQGVLVARLSGRQFLAK